MLIDEIENNCGPRKNSRCVDYEGKLNDDTTITSSCVTVHKALEDIYCQLNSLLDLSSLGQSCYTYDADFTIVDILKKYEEVLESLDPNCTGVTSTTTTTEVDISTLNTDCLVDPCNDGISDLIELLQALIDKVCSQENTIQTLSSDLSSAQTDLTQAQADIIDLQTRVQALENG